MSYGKDDPDDTAAQAQSRWSLPCMDRACFGTSSLSFTLPTESDLITIGVLLAVDCVGRDV
jgi:hypothetical protein